MLKEKIIALIANDECIFEPFYTVSETGAKRTPVQYNLAGLICRVAGLTPQGNNQTVRIPVNAPIIERQWLEFENVMALGTTPKRNEFELEIHALARQIWAFEYGDDAARELPFYDKNQNVPGTCWWDALPEVLSEDIVYYLRGAPTFRLNKLPLSSNT